MEWVRQNPAVATALIAACGALFGALIAAAAKFIFDFYLSECIKRRWKTIDTKRQYSSQIIRAADELAGRIANMSRYLDDGAARVWLRPISDEEAQRIPFERYYFSSTIFLFCRLVAWIEVLKREQIFLDFASTRETRKFNSYLELIYSIISYAGLTSGEQERQAKNHWIYYHYITGIGDSLFTKDADGSLLRCITFHEFCVKYKGGADGDFRAWVREVELLFEDLSSEGDDFRWQRLQMLWLCLDQFLQFVDPKSLRTTRTRLQSRSLPVELQEKVANQAKWHHITIGH